MSLPFQPNQVRDPISQLAAPNTTGTGSTRLLKWPYPVRRGLRTLMVPNGGQTGHVTRAEAGRIGMFYTKRYRI